MTTSYRNILKTAFKITIENKLLWFFGIFASLISFETIYEILLSQANRFQNIDTLYYNVFYLYENQINFINENILSLNNIIGSFSAFTVFSLIGAIVLIFIWLAFISQIFIIKSAASIYKNNHLPINQTFSDADKKFAPVFGLSILAKLVLYVGHIALTLPLLYALLMKNEDALIVANFIFFILFTIFAIVVNFITAYAINYIVLKDYHIIEAISAAWKLFKQNITISLEIALILYFLKLISIIIIICLFLLFFVPLCIIFLIALSLNDAIGIIMTITLIILSFIVIGLFITAFFSIFYLSSWTITFLQLTENNLSSKIKRYLSKIPFLFNKTAKLNNLDINTDQIKNEAKKLAHKAEKEALILAKKLDEKYQEYEPIAKKQGKQLAQKVKKFYSKIEPEIKKEIKKTIQEIKKKNTTKRKPVAKKTSKATPKAQAKKKTVAKRNVKTKAKPRKVQKRKSTSRGSSKTNKTTAKKTRK